jgi:hypothetical protein
MQLLETAPDKRLVFFWDAWCPVARFLLTGLDDNEFICRHAVCLTRPFACVLIFMRYVYHRRQSLPGGLHGQTFPVCCNAFRKQGEHNE